MEKNYLKVAAEMLGSGDVGMLNYKLAGYLNDIDYMCQQAGGELKSRQVIAVAIIQFGNEYPDTKLYGD